MYIYLCIHSLLLCAPNTILLRKTKLHCTAVSEYSYASLDEFVDNAIEGSNALPLNAPSYESIPGADNRFPVDYGRNHTEIQHLTHLFLLAKLLYQLETPLTSIEDRAELAKGFFEMDKPRTVNIKAGGLMDFWEDSI